MNKIRHLDQDLCPQPMFSVTQQPAKSIWEVYKLQWRMIVPFSCCFLRPSIQNRLLYDSEESKQPSILVLIAIRNN